MRRLVSHVFLWLSLLVALVCAYVLAKYFADESFQKFIMEQTRRDSESFPYLIQYVGIGQVALLLVGYGLSLDTRRGRPWLSIIGGAFGTGLTFGFAQTALDLLEFPLSQAAVYGAAGGGIAVVGLLAFELTNRFLWSALLGPLDKKKMGGAALWVSHLSLLFNPGQKSLLRSVQIERFRRGVRGEVGNQLRDLHAAGDRGADLLETLCQLANEERKPAEFLGYLGDLLQQFPNDLQLREAYTQELLEQKKTAEAAAFIERNGIPGDADGLERYAGLLVEEKRADDAVEACRRLGDVEGIPMRRSEAMLRRVLALDENHLAAINLLADHAGRMARKDQEVRWLEKSLALDRRQGDRRERLIGLLAELDQTNKLEPHLRDLVAESPHDTEAIVFLGRVLLANGKPSDAAELLQDVVARGHGGEEAELVLGTALLDEGRLGPARKVIEGALARSPQPPILDEFAALLKRLERTEFSTELAEELERAEAQPEDLAFQLRVLERLVVAGHADRAVSHADAVLSNSPGSRRRVIATIEAGLAKTEEPVFPVLDFLADLQCAENAFDGALDTVQLMATRSLNREQTLLEGTQKILRRSPHHLRTLRALGDLHREHGRFTEMIHAYSLYLSNSGEEDETIDEALARAYISLNDYTSARRFVQSLVSTGAKSIDRTRDEALLKQIIPMAIAAEKPDEAAEFLKRLEFVGAGDKEVRALRLSVNESVGQQRFSFLQRELENGKADEKMLEELGDLCREQDDLNAAVSYYQRAARQTPGNRVPIAKLAYCFARKRLFDLCGETMADLRLSLDNDPEELEHLMIWVYRTGEALEEARLFESAGKVFKQLMKIDAGYKDVLVRVERLGRM